MAGCVTKNSEPLPPLEVTPELKPLPPQKLYDLLQRDGLMLAYKSITKKDYEAKDEC